MAPRSEVTYDRRAGQFRGTDGRFVSRVAVDKLIEGEITRTEAQLLKLAKRLTNGDLDLGAWEKETALTIKASHLRMMVFAAGGKDQLESRYVGLAGTELRRQYGYLNNFSRTIAGGTLTPAQIHRRAQLYARSAKITFNRVQKSVKQAEGFNVAKRLLDAQAKHCGDCIGHERREWTEIGAIVPPGVSCECQNRCKCRLLFMRLAERISA